MNIWDAVLIQPLLNGILLFYKLTGNLGIAIIVFTVFIRLILAPLTIPGMKQAQKMKEVAPNLEKLKLKYKGDKQGLAKAQMELYRQNNINPAAGCLPQILQLIILFALFQVFIRVLSGSVEIAKINELLYPALRLPSDHLLTTKFLYLDLAKPDTIPLSGIPFGLPGLFLLASAAAQYVSFKMTMPAVKKEEKVAKKTVTATDDFMVSMQQSMLWMFPLMTIFAGFAFPSGLVLYWFVYSAFQVGQQYIFNKSQNKAKEYRNEN